MFNEAVTITYLGAYVDRLIVILTIIRPGPRPDPAQGSRLPGQPTQVTPALIIQIKLPEFEASLRSFCSSLPITNLNFLYPDLANPKYKPHSKIVKFLRNGICCRKKLITQIKRNL
jgi:hypothetical protein